jgi:hypothetical protein
MRDDTRAAIAKSGRSVQGKYECLVDELESRLSPDRKVLVAFSTVGHGGPSGSDIGVILLTDHGIHWKGEGLAGGGGPRLDLPWEKMHRAEVVMDQKSSGVFKRKETRDYDLVVESTGPDYRLSFRLYEDDRLAGIVREALRENQPLL